MDVVLGSGENKYSINVGETIAKLARIKSVVCGYGSLPHRLIEECGFKVGKKPDIKALEYWPDFLSILYHPKVYKRIRNGKIDLSGSKLLIPGFKTPEDERKQLLSFCEPVYDALLWKIKVRRYKPKQFKKHLQKKYDISVEHAEEIIECMRDVYVEYPFVRKALRDPNFEGEFNFVPKKGIFQRIYEAVSRSSS